MLEKNFELVSSEGNGTIVFYLSLALLPVEVNHFLETQNRKRDALVARSTGRVEIVFALLANVIALYVQIHIV